MPILTALMRAHCMIRTTACAVAFTSMATLAGFNPQRCEASPSASAFGVSPSAVTAPSLTIASINGTAINLTWTTVSGATYNLYRSTTSGGQGTVPVVSGIASTSYSNTGLAAGTAYYYTITAVVNGVESAQSAQVGAKTIAAPATISVVSGNGAATVSWSAVAGATCYRVYRGASSGAETVFISGVGGLSFTDTGLSNGQVYYYQVTGLVSTGSIEGVRSAEVTASPAASLPAAPQLTAVPTSAKVNLSWPSVGGATSYKVKRSTAPGGVYVVLSSPATTSYIDTPPSQNISYYYVVSAVNGTVIGPNSNEAAAAIPGINSMATLADSDDRQDTPTVNYGWKNVISLMALGTKVRNTYLTFDLKSASGTVSSAALKLYKASGAADTETVYGVTPGSWAENTIVWNNAPKLTGTGIATLSTAAAGTYYTFDVTAYVQAQQAAGATSVSFALSTTSTTEIDFYSRENASSRPQLALTVGAPLKPTGLTATGGLRQIALSWNATPGAATYNLYRGTGASSTPEAYLTGLTGASYTDTGLSDGVTYRYTITAVNANGESAQPAAVAGLTSAGVPSALAATAGNAQVALSWSAPAGAVTRYNIYRGTSSGGETLLASPTGTAAAYLDAAAVNGTAYYYKVSAVNATGEGNLSSEVSATPLAPPAAPSGLTATPSNAAVSLSWTAPAGIVTGYKIYRGVVSGTETFLVAPSGSATTYVNSGLSNGTLYYYKVSALNGGSEGPLSAEVSAKPHNATPTVATAAAAAPSPVTGSTAVLSVLGADDGGEPNLTYTWAVKTAPTGASPAFSVNGTNAAKSSTVTFDRAGAYAFTVTIRDTASASVTSTVSVTVNQTVTSLTVSPLKAVLAHGGTQTFTAACLDQFGAAIASPALTWSVDSGGVGTINASTAVYSAGTVNGSGKVRATKGSISATADVSVVSAAPLAPASLVAVSGTKQITLSWNASADTASYKIYRGTTAGGESATALNASVLYGTSYTDSALVDGSHYFYQVKAVNGVGSSPASNEANAYTYCAAPASLTATPANAQAQLTWPAVTGAVTYNVKRSVTSGSGYSVVGNTAALTFNNTGLTNGTPYYYVVTAVNPAGDGPASVEAQTTPLAAPAAPTNLTAAATGGVVQLAWTASANASSYSVYRGTAAGAESATALVSGIAAVSYTDMNIANDGTTYYYYVKAVGVGGTSPASVEVAAKPIDVSYLNCLLTQDANGLLYGTSGHGGANNTGAVFSFDPSTLTLNILHSFGVPDADGFDADGSYSVGGVILATDGALYGVTGTGGTKGLGTMYKIDSAGTFSVVHTFTSYSVDGGSPLTELIQAADGKIYGTTPNSVFRYDPTAHTFQPLHIFTGTTLDGSNCLASLVEGPDHQSIYGVTQNGGTYARGVVFVIDEATGDYSIRSSLDQNNPYPQTALMVGDDLALYGITSGAQAGRDGTFYTSASSGFATALIHVFAQSAPTPSKPYGPLVELTDKNFYGVSKFGGTPDKGTVFKVDKSGNVTALHEFTGYVSGNAAGSDGANPTKGVLLGKDGNLYGVTPSGGAANTGGIYRVSPTNGTYTWLHSAH